MKLQDKVFIILMSGKKTKTFKWICQTTEISYNTAQGIYINNGAKIGLVFCWYNLEDLPNIIDNNPNVPLYTENEFENLINKALLSN